MGMQFTIAGRLVQGDPYKGRQKIDDKTKALRTKADGSPMMDFYVALAVPKNDPAWPAFKALCDGEASRMWPNGEHRHRDFANKIEDGDSTEPNKKGKTNASREGHPGHWIVKLSSGFAAKVIFWGGTGWDESIPGVKGPQVKIGDFVTIIGTIDSNGSAQSPGMYMNLQTIAFEREGPAIAQEIDYNAVLGARGPGTTPPPVTASAPPPPGPSVGAPPPLYSEYMSAPPPPPPAPVPSGPTMTAKAGGSTYQSFIDAGWTNAQLIQNGMMLDDGVPY